tara:strand:+ start:205 stop:366 length:162 start_codon:yes stop_codon:yes gene_type:complete
MADNKKLKSVTSWGLKIEVEYDDETTKTITGNDISEYLCQCIDNELTEIEEQK